VTLLLTFQSAFAVEGPRAALPVSLPLELLLPLSLCLWRGALRPSGRFFLMCGPDALHNPFAKHMLPLCKEPARLLCLLILSLCCAPDSILVFLRSAGEMLPLYEELARLLRCNVVSYDYAG